MKPLEIVYWLRFGFGVLAAVVDLAFGLATNTISTIPSSSAFFNSASFAIIVYALSYYIIKAVFASKVQKPGKLATTGIGIYFLAWIMFWALFYTLFAGA